jgi:hypothetical protein
MQIHEEQLAGASRPCAPSDCARCKGAQKLHVHSSYERNANCTGGGKKVVCRFLCRPCGATFGVIPSGMLPYRSLPVERLEAWMDDLHEVSAPAAGGGARPPPASEVERGCLERAQENLLQRIPYLSGLLGQRLPLLARGDIRSFWRALRSIGRLAGILVHLAGNFKISLLRDYLSLLPHWQRREAPA